MGLNNASMSIVDLVHQLSGYIRQGLLLFVYWFLFCTFVFWCPTHIFLHMYSSVFFFMGDVNIFLLDYRDGGGYLGKIDFYSILLP